MTIIFLTYINRSGSTYLANLLSASESICVCPEGDRLVSLFLEDPGRPFHFNSQWKKILSQLLRFDDKLKYWEIGEDVFSSLKAAKNNIDAFTVFLRHYMLMRKPAATGIFFKAERLVDLYAGIHRNEGNGIAFKYLSLVRDPRAIYASQKRTIDPGTNQVMSKNPVFTAMFWNHFMRENKKNIGKLKAHLIGYRELIEEMEVSVSGLSEYLEMDLEGISPDKGDLSSRLPDGHRKIHQNISTPPDPEKLNQWKEELSRKEIWLIERKCRKNLMKEGFKPTDGRNLPIAEMFDLFRFTLLYRWKELVRKFRFHYRKLFNQAGNEGLSESIQEA